MAEPVPVNNLLYNSARWDAIDLRDGDIVISTPSKCGTTWTQRIVSLLVFDSAELPAPLARVSPWLDMNTRRLDEVIAELDAQTHRRFIKSHLPYDLLPHDDRVTFITVGRDPRDVAVSMAHHIDNVDIARLVQERVDAVGGDDLAGMDLPPPPATDAPLVDRFWHWVETDGDLRAEGLREMVAHLGSFWARRGQPNVVLLHYDDLQRDLVGQMAALAARLGLDRSLERLEQLAPAASFAQMRADAGNTAPNGDQTFWRNTADFFHRGESGQWRDVAGDELTRYEERLDALGVDGEFRRWLHHGTLGPSA